MKNVL